MVPNREPDAGVAHPVERHLAKVEVASSSLVTRSRIKKQMRKHLLLFYIDNPSLFNPPQGLPLPRIVRYNNADHNEGAMK